DWRRSLRPGQPEARLLSAGPRLCRLSCRRRSQCPAGRGRNRRRPLTLIAMQGVDDPIPISALQHAVYCLRQAALIHIERLWAENRYTAEGRVLHGAAHEPSRRTRGAVRRVTALPLACRRLNLSGTADLVEFRTEGDGETAFPVEYKRGKPKLH